MKTFKALLLAGAFTFCISSQAQTKNIEGIDFPEMISMNGQQTVLNGGGLRTKLIFPSMAGGGIFRSPAFALTRLAVGQRSFVFLR